jgi:2-polyprenyl-3-methyl-5-hydroxy-6-metoxy-1,4-benzoquinol methylase
MASLGVSSDVLYARAAEMLHARGGAGRIADIGCGHGRLRAALQGVESYIGLDVVRFDTFPADLEFRPVDIDRDPLPLQDGECDVVIALETIEHLENPRRFVRELRRVTRPGGIVLVSTPNQRSLLSLTTLLFRGEFGAFQASDYPAHITALLEVDLRRIAVECGLTDVAIDYSRRGRLPLTGLHYPAAISRAFPRGCSDHVFLVAAAPRG